VTTNAHVRLKLDRLTTLTDGVTAIVMTILVLSIAVPPHHDFSQNGLVPFVRDLSHDVLVYAVTFLMVGGYWVQHHSILHYAEYGNRTLIWLHMLFLLLLSLVPFTTALKASYREEPRIVLLLGVLHMAIGLVMASIWLYLRRSPWLLRRPFGAAVSRSLRGRILAGQAICVAAVLAAQVSVRWGPLIFLAVPLLYVSNPQVDLHWSDPTEPKGDGSR
jgi:uncharacterized membrane protein